MKRILSITLSLCILLSCTALFAGCSSESSKDWPVTIGGITIDKQPEKIVVLNDVFADIISYIGYDVKLVGRSEECDQEFLHIVPSVGRAAAPDSSAISSTGADLVIADSTLDADIKANIESSGAKVATLSLPTTSDELKALYTDLGTAIGGKTTGSAKGETGYNGLMEMLGTMNTATSNVVQTVAYLYLDENSQPCTFVKDTLEYRFFNYNGNTNVFSNQTTPNINLDELRIGSPNYIFYDDERILTILKADEKLAYVNALVNNHTCRIPKKSFSRFGKSAEQAIFDILNYIDKSSKATPDEASADTASKAASTPSAASSQETSTQASSAANDTVSGQSSSAVNFSIEE